MANVINWFEIPSTDFDRAVTFYSTILRTEIRREAFLDAPMAVFTSLGDNEVAGAIVCNDLRPSTGGALIYLNANGQLDAVLARVESAGGAVVQPAMSIGPQGEIAIIRDTEGNHVGLHSKA